MTETERGDAAWAWAVNWTLQDYREPRDGAAREALQHWLAEAPAHRQVYRQVRGLWLITGLIPTRDEQGRPPPGSSFRPFP